MERGASPTPSACHSTSSQDYGRPRKSAASYRLFPIVEPTPPGSPVVARRSSHTTTTSTLQPNVSLRESRKVSLPDIRPLQTVKELDSATSNSSPLLFDRATRVCASDDRVQTRVTSAASDRSTPEGAARAALGAHGNARHGDQDVASPTRLREFAPSSDDANVLLRPSSGHAPRSRRSKPNLRITVNKGSLSGPPRTPDRTMSTLAQRQSSLSVGADGKVCGPTVTPPAARGHSVRKFWPKIFPREEASLSPKRSIFSNDASAHTQNRPRTAGFLSPPSPRRPSTTQTMISRDDTKDMPASSRTLEATKVSIQSPPVSSEGRLGPCKSAEPLRSEDRPENPGLLEQMKVAEGEDATRAQRFPGSALDLPRATVPVRPSTADDRESIADTIRKHAQTQNHPRLVAGDFAATPSLVQPQASTALAIARANVAALRQSSLSAESPRASEFNRSSGSELGSFNNRALAAEALTRRPSCPGGADPVATLRDLSEQCDALHARYAGLRAERQKMSSGIIEKLKEPRMYLEHMSALLDDQLSLAAVSSSMDICFAKLKSLECQKEDAVSTLIAQTTDAKRSASENMSAMMGLGSRKSSFAPSAESESRYAPTGRSTPDMGDRYSQNRSTQSSLPRSFSYSSESSNQEYQASCASSLRNDTALQTEHNERQAPETIPEAVESPRHQYAMQKHQLIVTQPSNEDDKPFILSPIRYTPSQKKVVNDSEAVTSVGTELENRQSSDTDVSETLDVTSKRVRVPGSKAAQVLGLLPKDGKDDPLVKLPPELANLSNSADRTNEVRPRAPRSAHTLSILPTNARSAHGSAEQLESPAIHDLEEQLQHFPKPVNLSARTRSNSKKTFSILAPLSANPPTPLAASFEERDQQQEEEQPVHPPRRDSARATQHGGDINKPMARRMTQGSTRTTHTIQVYLEQDDLEILDLYRRGSEGAIDGAIAAAFEPMPVR